MAEKEEPFSEERLKEFKKAAGKFGYPVFMRTDETSCKHSWGRTCFVKSEEDLMNNLFGLLEENEMLSICGLPYQAIVFRRYIQMDNLFKAFSGMPVNPEIRMFINDGKVECWHWYWVEDAIASGTVEGKLPSDWKEVLHDIQKNISEREMKCMTDSALRVAAILPGRWSVDFCRGENGTWYLIDMALWESSWHPWDCPNCPEDVREHYKPKEKKCGDSW